MVPSSRHATRRAWADRVLQRSAFLLPHDRAIVEQVLGDGVRPADLAAIARVSTRTIQRRVRQLAQRLTDPEVELVLRQHHRWPHPTAAVALALWVRGLSQRRAAAELNLSLHKVRQHAQIVRGLIQTNRKAEPA